MEQSGSPLVSICSQVLNQKDWLKEMLQSVVDQTYPNWELLIVDDGSTEDIKSVIESFNDKRIKYYRFDERKGIPFGTNHAIKQAQGKYICLMAADEIYWKDKLKEQVAYLEANPKVDACWGLPGSGSWQGVWPLGHRPSWEQYTLRAHNRSREAWLRTLLNLENIPIGGLGLMMKKSVMDDLGGLDENLTLFSDHELYCRFFEKYVGAILPIRVGIDKPVTDESVRFKNQATAQKELDYVRSKHKLLIPPMEGKVTVGIPCYNHAKYLPDAVASVLAQTHPVDEILILNDCSTDDFKTVVLQFTDPRIKVMAFDENRGIQESLNQMAFRAEGDFFVVLAADDTLAPTFVEECLAEFKANPWTEMVASQTDFFTEDMKTPAPLTHPFWHIQKASNKSREQWLEELYNGNQYFGVGMYRTTAISEVGGWEKEYKVISDYQMYVKLLQRENIRVIEKPLTHTRIHGENNSLLNKKRAEELPWLYHAARKPYYRQRMRVVIATPFYELKGFSPYITSLAQTMRLLTAHGIDWRYMELSGDSYVHRARNTMVDMFLRDPDATDLFFVDSDMSWNPEAFVKMCLLPQPVVGGSYPVKNKWDAWTSIPKIEDNGNGTMSLKGIPIGDGTALVEAAVLAGGFLRIKRGVFEAFRAKYPDLWYQEPTTDPDNPEHKFTAFFGAESIDHKFYGEDHCFAKRLREMDLQMFIYPNVDIVHWGYKDFAGNYDKFLRAAAADNGANLAQTAAMGNEPGQRLAN
jgi:glycosyltransferase involved in cell wall biosynthesis